MRIDQLLGLEEADLTGERGDASTLGHLLHGNSSLAVL